MVIQYEEFHFPIGLPTIEEMIELCMLEIGLTINVANVLHQKLNFDSNFILQQNL